MSTSETITKADLTNILNKVLPIGWVAPTKTKTLTATTDSNGNLALGLSASTVQSVISVVGSNYVYIPFVYSGNWYAKVVSSNSVHTAIVSESVSVTISYLEYSAISGLH